MKQRLTYFLPFVALTALAVANGCGDDDDDDYPSPQGSSGTGGKGGTGGTGGKGGGGAGNAGRSGTGGAGQGGAGAAGAGQGGAGAAGAAGAGQGGAGEGGAGAAGAGQGGAGEGGAGQGGAGEGGAGQGGAGQGGAGGVPVVIPSDKCETAPVVEMPSNQLGQLISGQSFVDVSNDYSFKCGTQNVANGADLAFGIKTNGLGLMTIRTRDVDPNLNVAIIGAYACGTSLGDAVACANQQGSGKNEQFAYITKSGVDQLYIMVESESTAPSETQKFSLEGFFNLALTQAAVDSCTTPAVALPLKSQIQGAAETDKDVLVLGSTATAKSDYSVPVGTAGSGGAAGAGGGNQSTCSATAAGLDVAKGNDQIVAVTPQASGSVAVFVSRAPGDTTYVPVVWAHGGGCEAAGNLGCKVANANSEAFLSFNVTQGQTYYTVIDSLNANTGGQYLAFFQHFGVQNITVTEEPVPGRANPRYIVRGPDGSVLRVVDLGNLR
jgi:hypothetical protein